MELLGELRGELPERARLEVVGEKVMISDCDADPGSCGRFGESDWSKKTWCGSLLVIFKGSYDHLECGVLYERGRLVS